MKVLVVGTGGIGQSMVEILKQADPKSEWLELMVLADYDFEKAKKRSEASGEPNRFPAEKINARDKDDIIRVIRKYNVEIVVNACDPSFNMQIFDAAFDAGIKYIDLALSLSQKHPTDPYNKCGLKLGDLQFAKQEEWKKKGLLAILGIGCTPGASNVFAKYAEKYLMDKIDEIHIRCGGGGIENGPAVAFTWSPWTAIEESLNPPIYYDRSKGLYTKEAFADPEIVSCPVIGDLEMVSCEHEDVIMVANNIDCNKVDFKICFGQAFVDCIKYLQALNLDRIDTTVKIGGVEIVPRDFITACAPDSMVYADQMKGTTITFTQIIGEKDGMKRNAVVYVTADLEECRQKYKTNGIVAVSAFPACIALELIAKKLWNGVGVLTPEAFEPKYFMERMEKYGFPGYVTDFDSEYKLHLDKKAVENYMK